MLFNKVPTVTWSDIDKNAKIIDVREPHEYQQRHAKGSKNVPLSKIDEFQTIDKVYIVCASGSRSKRAVKYLRRKGMDAVNIKGGMMTYGK
ncbi:MAG: rhodanese-like domain-containing protein [Erysipelothrix sp.]